MTAVTGPEDTRGMPNMKELHLIWTRRHKAMIPHGLHAADAILYACLYKFVFKCVYLFMRHLISRRAQHDNMRCTNTEITACCICFWWKIHRAVAGSDQDWVVHTSQS